MYSRYQNLFIQHNWHFASWMNITQLSLSLLLSISLLVSASESANNFNIYVMKFYCTLWQISRGTDSCLCLFPQLAQHYLVVYLEPCSMSCCSLWNDQFLRVGRGQRTPWDNRELWWSCPPRALCGPITATSRTETATAAITHHHMSILSGPWQHPLLGSQMGDSGREDQLKVPLTLTMANLSYSVTMLLLSPTIASLSLFLYFKTLEMSPWF